MKAKRILIVAAVAGLGVTTAYVGWNALRPTVASHAAEAFARHAHFGGHHRGWARGWRGHPKICSDRRDRRIEDAIGFVEGFANFTPAQTERFEELAEAVRAGSASVGETCAALAEASDPVTAPQRLARLETMVAAGLGVIQRVRPAFDGFYASLDDKQKKLIDDLMSRQRSRPRERGMQDN